MNAEEARSLVAEVCIELGLTAKGARLLGPVADNAVFLLPDEGLVARLSSAQTVADVRRRLDIASWLESARLPAVRASRAVSQPLVRDGYVVTFWEEIPGVSIASTGEIGAALYELHRLSSPVGLLEAFDPFVKLDAYLRAADGVGDRDRDFLQRYLAELRSAYAEVEFALPPGPIHGDAHRKNIVRGEDGVVRLLDLDHFSEGAREWDLIVSAVYHRVGWYTDQEYRDFVDAYGFDVTKWAGYEVLAGIRQLRMTGWLAARTGREPRLVPEVANRIASLRNPAQSPRWTPGT